MAASESERTKAAKLRARLKKGKSLKPEQRTWLDGYEQRTVKQTIRAAKAKPSASTYTAATVRGPQLQIAGTSSASGGHIHATTPPDGTIDPLANLWTPTVPPATEGAAPPPPGAPPPPTEGTPIVGAAPDPRAGEQLAFLVVGIAMLGIKSAMDLLNEYEIPDDVKPYLVELVKPENIIEGRKHLAEACKRLAVKYKLSHVPMSDELLVGGVVAGSGLALTAKWKRKKLAAPKDASKKRAEVVAAAPSSAPSTVADVAAGDMPDALAGKWGGE